MTSEATRKAVRDKELNAEALKIAQTEAAARSEEEVEIVSHTAPLARDEAHSFVPAEPSEFTAEELAPNLTQTGLAGLQMEEAYITIKANDIEHKVPLTESRLETMTDEDIADAGLLTDAPALIHPARLNPSSERSRTPLQRSPAAGPGTWPVPEDQLPAVVPSDPPKEEGDEGEAPGDATLSGYPPFKVEGRKVVVYSSEGARSEVEADETRNAAALYLRLRNQFPHFTEDQLSDEFIIQWESRVGAKQSMRPAGELSQHGLTAVGDERLEPVNLGEARKEATQAQPRSLAPSPPASVTPEAGLPSVNEPATRAIDDEKFGLQDGETGKPQDAADIEAMQLTKQYREAEAEAETAARQKRVEEAEAAAKKEARERPEEVRQAQMQQGQAGSGASIGSALPPPLAAGARKPEAAGEKSPAKSEPKPASKPDEPRKG